MQSGSQITGPELSDRLVASLSTRQEHNIANSFRQVPQLLIGTAGPITPDYLARKFASQIKALYIRGSPDKLDARLAVVGIINEISPNPQYAADANATYQSTLTLLGVK